ncbi:MAG: TOBE domain-containing protein [Janthinobacterium lividum]
MSEISPQRTARPPRLGDALGHGASDRRIDILRGIALSGSISQAARESGVSYKAAWQAVDTLTNLAGVPLVVRAVGGAGGGGASLTAEGRHLLELAEALDVARRDVQARWLAGGAGTLHADTAIARLAVRTSMRNQLPATIDALVPAGRTVSVRMRLGASGVLAARITRESVELLGLREEMEVVALCKAMAVHVERFDTVARAGRCAVDNTLTGSVTRVLREENDEVSGSRQHDEVSVMVDGGLQLVGFAPRLAGLRTRHRATVVVDEASVVVALPP